MAALKPKQNYLYMTFKHLILLQNIADTLGKDLDHTMAQITGQVDPYLVNSKLGLATGKEVLAFYTGPVLIPESFGSPNHYYRALIEHIAGDTVPVPLKTKKTSYQPTGRPPGRPPADTKTVTLKLKGEHSIYMNELRASGLSDEEIITRAAKTGLRVSNRYDRTPAGPDIETLTAEIPRELVMAVKPRKILLGLRELAGDHLQFNQQTRLGPETKLLQELLVVIPGSTVSEILTLACELSEDNRAPRVSSLKPGRSAETSWRAPYDIMGTQSKKIRSGLALMYDLVQQGK